MLKTLKLRIKIEKNENEKYGHCIVRRSLYKFDWLCNRLLFLPSNVEKYKGCLKNAGEVPFWTAACNELQNYQRPKGHLTHHSKKGKL